VHESAAKEGSDGGGTALVSNERLEFLGDAVLGFIVARLLYDRFPAAREGELALRKSSLVSDAALAVTAERLGFGTLLVVGRGFARASSGPTRSMLAGAFEAFVAVLARAAGLDVATAFVEREHVERLGRAALPVDDPKTILQEWSQRHHGSTPRYVDHAEGSPQERTFASTAVVDGEPIAHGTGLSKKEAQRAAAARALELLSEHHDDVGPRKLSAPRQSSARPPSKKHRP
jgi:ribonuclease-3